MFKNSGATIKTLAKILFYFISISCVLIGMFLILFVSQNNVEGHNSIIITGLVITIGGVILAYIQSLLLYGYGELIETNQKIKSQLEKIK